MHFNSYSNIVFLQILCTLQKSGNNAQLELNSEFVLLLHCFGVYFRVLNSFWIQVEAA